MVVANAQCNLRTRRSGLYFLSNDLNIDRRLATYQSLYNYEYNKQIQSYSTKTTALTSLKQKGERVSLCVPSTRSTARIGWLIWFDLMRVDCCCCCKRWKWKRKGSGEEEDEEDKDGWNFFMDLRTLETATDNFSEENQLGHGGFGPVYKVFPWFLNFLFSLYQLRNWIDFPGIWIWFDLIFRGNLREWGTSFVRWPAGYCK